MTKKMIERRCEEFSPSDFSVEGLIRFLKDFEDDDETSIVSCDRWEYDTAYMVKSYSLETDEEYDRRINEQKYREEQGKINRRKNYELLKKEFENE